MSRNTGSADAAGRNSVFANSSVPEQWGSAAKKPVRVGLFIAGDAPNLILFVFRRHDKGLFLRIVSGLMLSDSGVCSKGRAAEKQKE
jgi:hypothetical protein